MTAKPMTGLEKAALLLKSLPAPVVDKVLKHLGAKHAGALSAELEKLKTDSQASEKLADVLEEAAKILDAKKVSETAAKTEPAPPPPAPVETSAKASQVDIRVDDKREVKPEEKPPAKPVIDPQADPLQALAAIPPELLASALDGENARTISLLINCLEITVAGEIYKRLSPAKRKEVSMRFTEQQKVNEELLKRIAQAVLRKCQAMLDSPASADAAPAEREKRMAALLRGLDRTERTEMLTLIGQSDAELVNRVKAMLYQFEDISLMENTSVQKLLADVDMKSLVLALSGAPPDIETKILTNLSKRAQAALREEAELSGKVTSARAQQGRQTIVEAIQRMDERGDLVMAEG